MVCPTRRGGTDGILVYRTCFFQPYNQSLAGSKYINNTVCHIAGDSIHLTTIGSNDYIYICHTTQSGFNGSERTHYIFKKEPSHLVFFWKSLKLKNLSSILLFVFFLRRSKYRIIYSVSCFYPLMFQNKVTVWFKTCDFKKI